MTRPAPARPILGLAAALLLALVAPVHAQEPPLCGGEGCEPRTLSHLDGVGATTSMCATRHGEVWQIELDRQALGVEGNASEQHMTLLIKSTPDVDRGLDALFEEAPAEPAEWERRIEEFAHVDIDFDQAAPVWRDEAPPAEAARARLQRAVEELRQAWRELRAAVREELRRRWHGDCHHRKDREVGADRNQGRLYR